MFPARGNVRKLRQVEVGNATFFAWAYTAGCSKDHATFSIGFMNNLDSNEQRNLDSGGEWTLTFGRHE